MKRLFLLGLAAVLGLSYLAPLSAAATTSIDYNNIIADTVFDNSNSMSATQIDTFLNGFANSCISKKNGFTAPDVVGYNSTDGFKYGSNVSAGTVIAHASQAYGINPQVLLATLQKEQSLVSGEAGCYNEPNPSWPSSSTPANGKTFTCSINGSDTTCTYACTHGGGCINVALGYGCPYYCKASYEGFSKQIINAAWKLTFDRHRAEGQNNWYLNKTNWDNSDDLQWCYSGHQVAGGPYYLCPDQDSHSSDPYIKHSGQYKICMSGTSGCIVVTIKDGATAALYNYTPFLHGQDLFFANFTNWFGPTQLKDNFRFEGLAGQSGSVLNVSSSDLGDYTTTLMDGDNIHTFYYDGTNHNLHEALWDGSRWSDTILDGTGSQVGGHVNADVGKDVTAIIYNNTIQVYYYDITSGNLRHAWKNGTGWHTEAMDGASGTLANHNADVGQAPTVLLYNGNLQLYYYDATASSLRHAWWPGGHWHFETMDGTSGSLGGHTSDIGLKSTAIVYNGDLQLYYYDKSNGNMLHAWWPGGHWHFETMDGTSGSIAGRNIDAGQDIAVTIYNGDLQIYYSDKTNGNLLHAWWPGGHWHFETMDGASGAPLHNTDNVGAKVVVQPFQKDLYLFYYDTTLSSWRAAYWSNGWYGYNLDGGDGSASGSTAAVGGQLSAGIYKDTSLQVFYKNASGGLNHAWANRK